MILAIDIDGTIADGSHRAHLLPRGSVHCLAWASEKQIEQYMAPHLVRLDAPIDSAIQVLQPLLKRPGKLRVVFVTARRERLRKVTLEWFYEHLGPHDYELHMRRDHEITRSSVAVKLEVAQTWLDGWGCLNVSWVDDDQSMLEAMRLRGANTHLAPECWDQPDFFQRLVAP